MANRIIPDYRPHERAFLPMTAPAKLCWVMATVELGGSGVGKCHAATLVPLTSLTLDEVEAGLAELEERGHLRRDGAVMWMVANLLEQGLNPRNANHRASVQAHLTSLQPLAPDLVAAYREHYVSWLQPAPEAPAYEGRPRADGHDSGRDGDGIPPREDREGAGLPSASHPDGIGMVSGSKEEGRKGGGEEGRSSPDQASTSEPRDLDSERGAAAGVAAGGESPPQGRAPRSPAAQGANGDGATSGAPGAKARKAPLPEPALALMRRLYGWREGEPVTERQRAVGAQLRETLAKGVRYERGVVRAVDADHLAWACSEVLAEPPKKRDVAIQWVLLKLRDTYAETLAARSGREARRAESEGADRLGRAEAWAGAHPELVEPLAAAIDEELKLTAEPEAERAKNPWRRTLVNAAVVELWESHGCPAAPDPSESHAGPAGDPAEDPDDGERDRAPPELASVG